MAEEGPRPTSLPPPFLCLKKLYSRVLGKEYPRTQLSEAFSGHASGAWVPRVEEDPRVKQRRQAASGKYAKEPQAALHKWQLINLEN